MDRTNFKFRIGLLILGLILFSSVPYQLSAQQITLDAKQEKLSDVLQKIQEQSQYNFLYNNTLVNVAKEVSISVKDADITNVLDKLLGGSGISYKIIDNQITLFPQTFNQSNEREIKGTITDSGNKEPLIGVTIINKRTNAVATSDIDGNYKIMAANGDVIEFSFIGMESQTLTVAPGANTNVALKASTEMLDEMVVVGYGTAKKISSIVGAATTVKSDVFKSVPAASAGDALQ